MKLILQRTHSTGARTFGKLFADGAFICYTLEDETREQPGVDVTDWKIKANTAIPSSGYAGRAYIVTLEQSGRFGPDTLTINDVPGFTAIRMHAGNTEADTEGCPLLGMAINAGGIVGGTSGPAVKLVKEIVRNALAGGETVTLEVVNPVETA